MNSREKISPYIVCCVTAKRNFFNCDKKRKYYNPQLIGVKDRMHEGIKIKWINREKICKKFLLHIQIV